MTKQEFIELARKNGVQNDSTNVWVVVDGYKYITSINYVLEYEEPFDVPDILNSLDVSLAWDDLYEQYCRRKGKEIMDEREKQIRETAIMTALKL